jgi:Ca-activated chloride channel homolog
MYISFTHPSYLAFLFAIPFIIFFHFYGLKNLKGKSLQFANFNAIARIRGIDIYSKNIGTLVFDILFVVILSLAIGGLTLHREMAASEFSYVLAIDSSRSMEAADFKPNRITVAKETAIDFVESLPYESYLAVVSFSGNTYTHQEMTKNKQEIIKAINEIEISEIAGTDINEAVAHSVNLLKDEENKAIILLSDGRINVGNVVETIDFARDNEVTIHCFGMGTTSGGEVSYGLSKIDEETLQSISYNTGGQFFIIDSREKMKGAFNEVTKITQRLGSIDLSFYLIMTAILLFIIKQFLLSINKIVW